MVLHADASPPGSGGFSQVILNTLSSPHLHIPHDWEDASRCLSSCAPSPFVIGVVLYMGLDIAEAMMPDRRA